MKDIDFALKKAEKCVKRYRESIKLTWGDLNTPMDI